MGVSWDDVRRAILTRPGQALAEGQATRAAVALVLREGPEGLELLFIRRADHPQDPWSGQMAFPGGRAEPGDDGLLDTAIRETREEIGLDLSRDAELLGVLDELRAMARMRPMDLTITPFVFRLTRDTELALSGEVTSVHWLPLAALLGPALRSTMEYVHQGTMLRFPCIRFEELVIWGLTYRMFIGFEERFGGGGAQEEAGA